MSFDDPNDVRFKPQDDCPLFSERLEAHLVAVYKGQAPNRGQFCGHCYTPVSRDTAVCSHCGVDARSGRKPVEAVPAPIAEALFRQRKIEARWVNGLASSRVCADHSGVVPSWPVTTSMANASRSPYQAPEL